MTSPSPRAALGLGCVTFGREIDAAASFRLLDHAWEHGLRHFDTAAAYGGGASERILGEWLRARAIAAEELVVATKMLPPYTPATVEASLRASLDRLGREQVEVFYLHRWDESAADPALLRALDRVVAAGRVGRLGFSNITAAALAQTLETQRTLGLAPFRVVQNNHNLAVRDFDDGLRRLAELHRIEVVTYSPLAAGFLTGKHRHGAAPDSRFTLIPGHQQVYFHAEAYRRLDHLLAVAARSAQPPTRLALAWALRQPGVSTVLVGGRTTDHLDQALAARSFADEALLTELSAS